MDQQTHRKIRELLFFKNDFEVVRIENQRYVDRVPPEAGTEEIRAHVETYSGKLSELRDSIDATRIKLRQIGVDVPRAWCNIPVELAGKWDEQGVNYVVDPVITTQWEAVQAEVSAMIEELKYTPEAPAGGAIFVREHAQMYKLDISALDDDVKLLLASLNEMATTDDREYYDLAWTDLHGVLRRLSERCNQGDTEMIDCPLNLRWPLRVLWEWLEEWNGIEKPDFGEEARQYFARVNLGAPYLLDPLISSLSCQITSANSTGTRSRVSSGAIGEAHQPIVVDLDKKTISLHGGEPQDVTSERALRWVKVLSDNLGDWISSAELVNYDHNLDGVRTDKLRQYLPEEVDTLIESSPGGGSRISIAVTRP